MELPQRKNTRLLGYDYSLSGYYYVTICSYQRECIFGKIINNHMLPGPIGKLIDNEWAKIPQKYTNINLDIFQVMPNHLHGIIFVGAGFPGPIQFRNQKTTLGKIMAYLKYQTTKQINQSGLVPIWFKVNKNDESGAETAPLQGERIIRRIWQRNYYEHIIRNEKELDKIREYIKLNPFMWGRDKNNPTNFVP